MLLSELFDGIKYTLIGEDKEIIKLEHNSKDITKGSLFFCIRGTRYSGTSFLYEAIENGCEAICIDFKEYENLASIKFDKELSIVVVDDVRDVIGYVCYNYYGASRFDFKLIGITGTNGKTTISFMLAHVLQKAGYTGGVIGTSGIFVNNDMIRGEGLTTPDPIDLYDILSFFYSVDVDYVIAEVSAHALDLKKLNGLVFEYGIFTNLTEDHLDYFKTIERYAEAKSKFFNMVKVGIFNIDDKFGKKLYKDFQSKKFSVSKEKSDYVYRQTSNGCYIIINEKKLNIKYNLNGEYNACNATESFAVLYDIIQDKRKIRKAFASLPKISGRSNEFQTKYHGKIILDFAHTPDGLEKILTSARNQLKNGGRLISVFGCGGNRDREKRPIMGKISGAIADYTIISIDNPRFEDPEVVMGDVEHGIKMITNNYNIIMPRENAIRYALLSSNVNDIIVVSGKGMEPYYETNGYKHLYREDIVIKTLIKRYDNKENRSGN